MNFYPRLNFIYSRPYLRLFFRMLNLHTQDYGFEEFLKEVMTEGKKFELIFQKYETEILKLISKYSGFEWSEKEPFLNIYLVKNIPSFSHPLTLSLKKDTNLMIGILIHELAHTNMDFDFDNEVVQEGIMNSISIAILSDLSIASDSYRNFAYNIFRKRFLHEFSENINVKEVTVKNYLSSFNSKRHQMEVE